MEIAKGIKSFRSASYNQMLELMDQGAIVEVREEREDIGRSLYSDFYKKNGSLIYFRHSSWFIWPERGWIVKYNNKVPKSSVYTIHLKTDKEIQDMLIKGNN